MSRPAKDYRPTLDGWRAVAILLVMFAHGGSALFCPGGRFSSAAWFSISQHGVFGVDLFFGISGLLICGRLLDEKERSGGISLSGFYIRRVFRILPPAFAYLAVVGLLAMPSIIAVSPREWLASVFFSRNYIVTPPDTGWYTGHFWSLAVEEHFYLIWPAALIMMGSSRARRYVPWIAIGVAVWRMIDFHWFHGQLWPGVLSDNIYERTDTRFDGLLWGCWIALVVGVPVYRNALSRILSPALAAATILLLVACIAFNPPFQMAWESFLVPVILIGTVLNPTRTLSRVLETSAMRWIGRISYSLYLWQQLFLVGWKVPRPLPFGAIQEFPLNVAAVFVCAAASYYLLERPLVALGHSLAAGKRAEPDETFAVAEAVRR